MRTSGCSCLYILSKGLTPKEIFKIQKHHYLGGRGKLEGDSGDSPRTPLSEAGFSQTWLPLPSPGVFQKRSTNAWSQPKRFWYIGSILWPRAKGFLEISQWLQHAANSWQGAYDTPNKDQVKLAFSLLHSSTKGSWMDGGRDILGSKNWGGKRKIEPLRH